MSDPQIDPKVFSEAMEQVENLRSQLRDAGSALENLHVARSTLQDVAGAWQQSADELSRLMDQVQEIVQKLREFLPEEVQKALRETRTELSSVSSRLETVKTLVRGVQEDTEALKAKRPTGTVLLLMVWTLLLAAGVVAWIELQPLATG